MTISTAVDLTRVSRVVGYKLKNARFDVTTPYLPQRIDVFAEANTANQSTLDNDPFEFINASEVGEKAGYGSPAYQIARIIRPITGNILGGIPTVMHLIDSDGGATEGVYKLGIAVATSVTANATHKVVINGRDNIDGQSFAYNVVVGDSAADVRSKIIDAINAVLGSPVTAAENVTDIDLTSKWGGATADLTVRIDTGDVAAGIVYSEVSNTAGTGTVDISGALANIGENWSTILVNQFGPAQFSALETWNGVPDPDNPTGRYISTIFKPLIALFGEVDPDKADIITITDAAARKDQVTNVLCPAPNSEGFKWEAAANMAAIWAPIAQNIPHTNIGGKSYLDMPIPEDEDIGDFSDYDARDYMAKRGASTVNLVNGKYTVQDFVTTYHPDSEPVPKFRYVRDLNIDWNMGYKWILIMLNDIQDKAIVSGDIPVRVGDTISPKQVKQLIISHVQQAEAEALIIDADFSIDSIQVGVNQSNPARLDIFFRYKRSSTANIVSTDVEVDFAYTI